MPRISFLIVLLIAASASLAAPAGESTFSGQAIRLGRPTKVGTTAADKSKVVGQVIWHDPIGFELVNDNDEVRIVRWRELPAQSAYEVYDKILGKGTADDWVQAGWVLRNLPSGTTFSDRAFARALHLDSKLQSQVDQAKSAPPPSGEPGEKLLRKGWPRLTEAQQSEAVAELKKEVADTPELKKFKIYETKFFLFYTDLSAEEGGKWAALLDKMYARLAEMFGLEPGRNIWRGKAVVIVFRKAGDFRDYEKKKYKLDSKDAAGYCHWDGTGNVRIEFYRLDKELDFAHLLVHESTHGFLHRFRTPTNIPSWANEGLAQWMGCKLVPNKSAEDWRRDNGKKDLKKTPIDDAFFTAKQIPLPRYDVAESLTTYMIAQNPGGYVEFINGLKDGLSVDESLQKKFHASRDELVANHRRHVLPPAKK